MPEHGGLAGTNSEQIRSRPPLCSKVAAGIPRRATAMTRSVGTPQRGERIGGQLARRSTHHERHCAPAMLHRSAQSAVVALTPGHDGANDAVPSVGLADSPGQRGDRRVTAVEANGEPWRALSPEEPLTMRCEEPPPAATLAGYDAASVRPEQST